MTTKYLVVWGIATVYRMKDRVLECAPLSKDNTFYEGEFQPVYVTSLFTEADMMNVAELLK